MARIGDLFGSLDEYNYKKTEAEADSEALRRDWLIVGRDIANAIKSYVGTCAGYLWYPSASIGL
jgi:hypothetical protein